MFAYVVVVPYWSGAVVEDCVSEREPSWFVVVAYVVEEPSEFSTVVLSVFENEPSTCVVVEV